MSPFEVVAPVLLLVLLGFALARVRFLGPAFMSDMNKLAFYVALPALIFHSVAHAEKPGEQTWQLLAVMLVATLIAAAAGWGISCVLRLPRASHGTLSQAAFRGNLAYIGIPVLSYAFSGAPGGKEAFATAVIVMTALLAFFNVLAVVVLQASREHPDGSAFRTTVRAVVLNPLLIAALAGLPLGLTRTPPPEFLDRALDLLSGAAVPGALLCIGGSLSVARLGSRVNAITAAAIVKTFALPLLVFLGARWLGLSPAEMKAGLVLAACPTAAAAYVMARQMDGDETLAGGSIVLSTILAAASLPFALLLAS